jgi:hypothetical protein
MFATRKLFVLGCLFIDRMLRVYYLTALTMTEHFIIRKNKSLKELGTQPHHHKQHRNLHAK